MESEDSVACIYGNIQRRNSTDVSVNDYCRFMAAITFDHALHYLLPEQYLDPL